jgi:hypothetical protein
MTRVVFAVLLVAAFGMFAWTVRRFARLIFSARPQDRTDRVRERIDSVMRFFFGQKKVVEKTTLPSKRWPRFVSAMGSKYHFFIFWGFLLITIGSVETLIQGLFPSFSLALVLGETVASALYTVIDFFCGLVLAIIAFAFFRRIVLQPRLIPFTRDAAAILGAIALLMISYFGMRFGGAGVVQIAWWVHVVILLAFLNYLLYSKHSHIIAALPQHLLPQPRPARRAAQAEHGSRRHGGDRRRPGLEGLHLEVAARRLRLHGVRALHELLPRLQHRQAAVAHAGRPRPARRPSLPHARPRPARRAAGTLPARRVPRGPARRGREAADRRPHDRGGAVGLHHLRRLPGGLPGLHRPAREDPADAPEPGAGAGEGARPISRARSPTSNATATPWGIGADKRMDWAEGMDVPTLDDKPDAEYLLWVGCAGAFDDRIKKQTRALVDVMREGGVDFAVLGPGGRLLGRSRRAAPATRCSTRCRRSRTSRR